MRSQLIQALFRLFDKCLAQSRDETLLQLVLCRYRVGDQQLGQQWLLKFGQVLLPEAAGEGHELNCLNLDLC